MIQDENVMEKVQEPNTNSWEFCRHDLKKKSWTIDIWKFKT